MPHGGKPEFSAAEMRRRRAAFGREMDRCGVSYALVYGANRSGSAVSWLTEQGPQRLHAYPQGLRQVG